MDAAILRNSGTRERGDDEGDHDGAERVSISQSRGFAICKLPQLFQRRGVAGVWASGNCAITLRHLIQESRHCAVRRRQIRGDRDKMEICPRIDNRSRYRDADRAAQIAHHVEKAAGIFQPIRRQAGEPKINSRRDRKHLRQAAKDLRDQELVGAPIMGNEAVSSTSRRPKDASPNIISQRMIKPLGENDVDGNADQRSRAGREDRKPGLPSGKTTHIAEKQRGEIDCGKDADAGDEGQKASEREISVCQRAQIDDRTRESQASRDEENAADAGNISAGLDGRIVEPIPACSFFEHIFERAEADRHQHNSGIIGILEKAQIRLIDIDEEWRSTA